MYISDYQHIYWVTQKFPQICTVILRICIGKVACFAVYICGIFGVTQYVILTELLRGNTLLDF